MRLPGSDVGKSGDRIERPEPDGSERVYSDRTTKDEIVRVVREYRLPITALVAVVLVGSGLGLWSLPDVPPEIRSAAIYGLLGSVVTLPAGYYIVARLRDERGIEVLDLDPVGDDHRHLRVGPDLWETLTVRTPYGDKTGTEDLRTMTCNGRTGYVVLDMRVSEEDGLSCVSSTVGSLSTVEMRTYRESLRYVRERLSRRANRAVALRSNLGPIAQEASERVVYELVRQSEESGMPEGEMIEETVEDVLSAVDIDAEPSDSESGSSEIGSNGSSNGEGSKQVEDLDVEDLGELFS